MLKDLRFVQGAVAKKDYEPSLTHFCVRDGKILGYNGAIALCTPTDLNITCMPKAVPFVRAVATCKDTVELHLTPNGRLCVRSGSFTAYVDCLEEAVYPTVAPEGQVVELPQGNLLIALKDLLPFVGQDATRTWARGILLRGQSAYATNNIIAIEKWLGYTFPVDINIPEDAVEELLRIGDEPTALQVGENSVTFHFADGKWLRTQLLTTEWPDLTRILDKEAAPTKVPEAFFPALHDLSPFVDDQFRVFFRKDQLSTAKTDGIGASISINGILEGGCYNIKQLIHLEEVVREIDFSQYPAPCLFYGDKIRGVIVGMNY